MFDFEKIEPSLEAAIEWLSRESPFVLGRSVLPSALLTQPADEVLSTLFRLVEHAGGRLKDHPDVKFIETLLAVGVGIAPHTTSTPNADLLLIRLVATMYVLSGRVQKARDLAEQGLRIGGDNPTRVRIAWYNFADIYHRLNNLTEALIAMTCALACKGDIGPEQALFEANALFRLLRDLNMTALAVSALSHCRMLAGQLGIGEAHEHRLVTMELGIRFRECAAKGKAPTVDELQSLIRALDENCKVVLERHDELAPVAMLLAQSIHLALKQGLTIEPGPHETLERALSELGDPIASIIRTVSAVAPTAGNVLALAGRLEPARYSDDAGFDVRFTVVSARRLLDTSEASNDAKVAAFAIELLADHGIRRPLAEGVRAEALSALPVSIEEAGGIAEDISRSGISVNLLGVTGSGRLARVTAEAGVLGDVVYETQDVFSTAMLESWSKEFPYRYGFEADDPNLFYTTGVRLIRE